MHVITKKRIIDFIKKRPDSETSLLIWNKIMTEEKFLSFHSLKKKFKAVDYVDGIYVFNICGNKYRLIAAIHFDTGTVFILFILTHVEYETNKWKTLLGVKK